VFSTASPKSAPTVEKNFFRALSSGQNSVNFHWGSVIVAQGVVPAADSLYLSKWSWIDHGATDR